MISTATIRHRELQAQAKELRRLTAECQASSTTPEVRAAKAALREFGEKLGVIRMSEVYDIAYAIYGPHALKGVSAAWTLVHGWNA